MFWIAQTKLRRRSLVAALIICLLQSFALFAADDDRLGISIPESSLGLQAGERIVSFELNIRGGEISTLPKMPRGWNICIDNEPDGTARIGGNARVGAAAIGPDFFANFATVKRRASTSTFSIDVKIGTLTNITPEQREIDLEMKALQLNSLTSDNE